MWLHWLLWHLHRNHTLNAKTEEIAKKTAVWRYGIMCAALLHDVGKTVTGFQVELFDSAISLEKLLWLPDTGSMAESGKLYYRVEFPDAKSAYSTHAEIAWTFFQALVIHMSDNGLPQRIRI